MLPALGETFRPDRQKSSTGDKKKKYGIPTHHTKFDFLKAFGPMKILFLPAWEK